MKKDKPKNIRSLSPGTDGASEKDIEELLDDVEEIGQIESTSPEANKLLAKTLAKFVRKDLSISFQGPVPDPFTLLLYDRAHSGAADRIIAMAERQAAHRHDLESQVVASQIKSSERGSIFGLVITCLAITSGTVIAVLNPSTAGVIVGGLLSGSSLYSLVKLFVYGKEQQKRELEEKKAEINRSSPPSIQPPSLPR